MVGIEDGGHGVVDMGLGSGKGGFWFVTLSGKFSFCRANRLTPPHSRPLRYGPAGDGHEKLVCFHTFTLEQS